MAHLCQSLGSAPQAADQGLAVWKEKGPKAYVTYHIAIYATGHHEGKLTAGYIEAAATKASANATNEASHTAILEKNSATGHPKIFATSS